MKILVTGGLGFIGSALIRCLIDAGHDVLNLDAETYAANPEAVASVAGSDRYRFERIDITDAAPLRHTLADFGPDAVAHLAAETHVDRSIDDPGAFVRTNVLGTLALLEAARSYVGQVDPARADRFRFLSVSTDEVYGTLGADDDAFDERSQYAPRSPYAASKAGADHLARAWQETFGLPVIVTNCSNNYGPFQFPEKLIPLCIVKAVTEQKIPVYGDGRQIRDWLFVDDHAEGLQRALEDGRPGQTYLFGGGAERTNLEIVETICDLVDDRLGLTSGGPRRHLIEHVVDRPGHDRRYAVSYDRARDELGWQPRTGLEQGLAGVVDWYLEHESWWRKLADERYDGRRLGAAVSPTVEAS